MYVCDVLMLMSRARAFESESQRKRHSIFSEKAFLFRFFSFSAAQRRVTRGALIKKR